MIKTEVLASVESQYYKSDNDYWNLLRDGTLELEKRTTQTTYHLRLKKSINSKTDSNDQKLDEIEIVIPLKIIKRSDNFYYFPELNTEEYCGLKFKNKKLANELMKKLKKEKGTEIISDENFVSGSSKMRFFRNLFCCWKSNYEPRTKESDSKKRKRPKILTNIISFFKDDLKKPSDLNLRAMLQRKSRKNKKNKHNKRDTSLEDDSGYSSYRNTSTDENNSEPEEKKQKKGKKNSKKLIRNKVKKSDKSDQSNNNSSDSETKLIKNKIKRKEIKPIKESPKDINMHIFNNVQENQNQKEMKLKKPIANLEDTNNRPSPTRPNLLDGIRKFDKSNLRSNANNLDKQEKHFKNADDLLKAEMAKRKKFLNNSDDD